MNLLANKTALVTGASRGIGRAIALALGEEEARVLVHYGRSQQETEAVVSTDRQSGGKADALQCRSLCSGRRHAAGAAGGDAGQRKAGHRQQLQRFATVLSQGGYPCPAS